jgi:hypothetical protein
MPRGDGTGPEGMGPMTGRGAGYCAGYDVPGYDNPMPGRGFGRGGGRGRRWRHWFYATGLPGWLRFGRAPWWGAPAGPPTREQETEALKAQAGWLQQQLDAINKRIGELDQESK